MIRILSTTAALLGLAGVALGAFGAHAMKVRLAPEMLEVWDTAVRYQAWHALATLGAMLFALHDPDGRLLAAGWAFVAGTVLFSGSLYLLALTGGRAFGMVTPLGGGLLILGWGCFAWALWRIG